MVYGCSFMKLLLWRVFFATVSALLLSSVHFVIVSATDITSVEWAQYKEKHMKVYTTAYEDTQRLKQYLKTKQMIEEHNEKFLNGEVKYTMGINQFADWYPKELNKLTNLKVDVNRAHEEAFELEPDSLPDSINWVNKGAVTEVKSQGTCGSCYAFSAAGALEGLMFIKNRTITDLSVQELIDCSSNNGCDGGLMTKCFAYVVEHNGIATEKSYPYEDKEGVCRADKKQIGASCTGWKELPATETALQRAVGIIGPVSTAFAVSNSFIFYKDGIYDGPCNMWINHAILTVGYDTDEKSEEDFWIIKNSWGLTWGNKGYAKVQRGFNLCFINSFNSFPTYT